MTELLYRHAVKTSTQLYQMRCYLVYHEDQKQAPYIQLSSQPAVTKTLQEAICILAQKNKNIATQCETRDKATTQKVKCQSQTKVI